MISGRQCPKAFWFPQCIKPGGLGNRCIRTRCVASLKRRTRKKGAPLGLFSCYLVAAAAAATTAVVIAAAAAAGVAAAIAATANQKQDDNPPDVAAEASVIPTHKKVPPCFLEFSEL